MIHFYLNFIFYLINFEISVPLLEDEKAVTDQHPELAGHYAKLKKRYSREAERQTQKKLMNGSYSIYLIFWNLLLFEPD